MTEFMNRLGDRVNPIVVKEMRQAVNSRFVSWGLILFLSTELIVMAVMLLGQDPGSDTDAQNLRTGREVFKYLQGILMVSCMLLIPALTGGRLASERSDVNVDLLFISSLSPRAIMAGKLFAAITIALLVFSACAPFMVFAYLLRGLDVPMIGVVLVTDFLAVLAGTMFALLLASIPSTRGLKLILGLVGIIVLGYVTAGATAGSAAFLDSEFGVDLQSWDFWLAFAGLGAAILGVIGLMFFWATALISPPTSNRAFLVRLYTFGFWVFGAVACAVWAVQIDRPEPVELWGILGTILFAFQMLIATSERDEWGPRVTRRIPRSTLLRIPAFLFYSGSAGGFAFGALGCAATIGGIYLWHATIVHRITMRSWDEEIPRVTGLITGYVYCFCMTAVAVRRLLHETSFKPSITWLIALILFGLGCVLPFIARSALFPKHYGSIHSDETIWLFLPSAPVMLDDGTRSSQSHFDMTVIFLCVWGVAITLLNLIWIARQIEKFRPPAPRVTEPSTDDVT